ncbi:hypothetical protein FGO68_gene9461 [Halteria grandinella]|uniref:Uncharacterized protein n=1 Tax=Halteria grandinella TaxID=5974 RepID=A0A8J8NYS5_HALGN|nr:hypothetical protein FGO68_gene9461 [Halteria grandinella]
MNFNSSFPQHSNGGSSTLSSTPLGSNSLIQQAALSGVSLLLKAANFVQEKDRLQLSPPPTEQLISINKKCEKHIIPSELYEEEKEGAGSWMDTSEEEKEELLLRNMDSKIKTGGDISDTFIGLQYEEMFWLHSKPNKRQALDESQQSNNQETETPIQVHNHSPPTTTLKGRKGKNTKRDSEVNSLKDGSCEIMKSLFRQFRNLVAGYDEAQLTIFRNYFQLTGFNFPKAKSLFATFFLTISFTVCIQKDTHISVLKAVISKAQKILKNMKKKESKNVFRKFRSSEEKVNWMRDKGQCLQEMVSDFKCRAPKCSMSEKKEYNTAIGHLSALISSSKNQKEQGMLPCETSNQEFNKKHYLVANIPEIKRSWSNQVAKIANLFHSSQARMRVQSQNEVSKLSYAIPQVEEIDLVVDQRYDPETPLPPQFTQRPEVKTDHIAHFTQTDMPEMTNLKYSFSSDIKDYISPFSEESDSTINILQLINYQYSKTYRHFFLSDPFFAIAYLSVHKRFKAYWMNDFRKETEECERIINELECHAVRTLKEFRRGHYTSTQMCELAEDFTLELTKQGTIVNKQEQVEIEE